MTDIFLTLRIICISLTLPCLLAITKFPRLLEIVESKKRDVTVDEAEIQKMIQKINIIAQFKFFLIRNNCLKKNLLFYYFLLQSGVKNVTINIGISKEDVKLDGHCWLTLNGVLFMESEEFISKYKVIYSSGV
jgi:hypothetical protein